MAKICIITFANTTDNYGQVLQYLATQEYLRARGHEPYLLISKGHKRNLIDKIVNRLKNFFYSSPKRVLSVFEQEKERIYGEWWTIASEMEAIHPRYFEEFRQKNFKMISCHLEEVEQYNFDAYVVGSDQTWGNSDELYYLGWAPRNAKRFAIAPSVAHYHFSETEINKLRPWVNLFKFVTVREKNGLSFCKRLGYTNAHQILDPTFLIPSTIYDLYTIPSTQSNQKPYIFLYLLGSEIELNVQDIFDFAHSCKLEVRYIASQGRKDDFPKEYARVDEWLGLLKNANYVITNSFHGMAFSIIYHKQFLTIPVIGVFTGMNVRIENIAKIFGLQNRIYKDNLNSIEEEIAWKDVDTIVYQNINKLNQLMESIDY